MLKDLGYSFDQTLSCTHPLNFDFFRDETVSCFDNDGFELSLLEQFYYKRNDFPLYNFLNHTCFQVKWFNMNDDNFVLDHSLMLERKSFSGEAKKQIQHYSKKFPQLLKYLKLKPKWGIDFALEYYKDDTYIEVLHIEYDYNDYDEAVKAKDNFQSKLLETDWNDFLTSLIRKKEEWANLQGFEQNDYKARYWGLPKAEITLKSFS